MARAFVSIGSNIDPEENVSKAIGLLNRQVRILGISTVYVTEPVGRPEQPAYYNCVISIDTPLLPLELKRTVLRPIEDGLGRVRGEDRFSPRTIDLDLVLYEDLVIQSGELTLPDPEIRSRPFLAGPLFELAPNLIMPDSKEPIAAIAARMRGSDMKPLVAYTNRLIREITT
jgi:dihydroneopterin aldolase/2-amino-4-hydroxy-6-hydroxymethyldihydropteridine diphosphokinase